MLQRIIVKLRNQSVVINIFDFLPHLVLFFEIALKIADFLTQQLIHFELFLYHNFEFLNIRVNIIVHKTDSLNGRNELTLLGQQLCIFLYSSHVCCEHFFLFLQYTRHFLLKGKKLLFILSSHSSFHSINVFSHLFLILIANNFLNLDLFLNSVSLFNWSYTFRWRYRLFYRISTILLFIYSIRLLCYLFKLLYILDWLYLFYQLFWNFFDYLFWRLSWLRYLLLFIDLVGTLRGHLILRILRFKNLLHVLRWRIWRIILCIRSIWIFISFLFLNSFCALDLLNILSSTFFFHINTIFTLNFVLTLIFFLDILVYLVVFFTQLSLVLQSFRVSQSVQAMISRRTSWRNTCNHYNFAHLIFSDKRISKNQCKL